MITKNRKKSILIITAILIAIAFSALLIGCGKNEVTVTFKAVGEEDIVMTVKYGGSVTPPEVPEKKGNYGYWDNDDLNKIKSDLTVNAVYETDGLQYGFIDTGMCVTKGYMDPETTELFIPTEYQGVPVTEIADGAFYKCVSLTSVTLPQGLIKISDNAFYSCVKITSICLPVSIKHIGAYSFWGSGIKSINLPLGVEIEKSAFEMSRLESIELPDGITRINENVFYCCSRLERVELPQSITDIGKGAFFACRELKSITLPENLTYIGKDAFALCSGLETIVLSSGLTSIGEGAFGFCEVETIIIPKSVTSVGYGAFGYWMPNQTIYVEGHTERPSGWDKLWNDAATVVWGC